LHRWRSHRARRSRGECRGARSFRPMNEHEMAALRSRLAGARRPGRGSCAITTTAEA
jgi:hypothetical protein